MLRFFQILILSCLLACASVAYAEDGDGSVPIPIHKKDVPPGNHNKHKAPSLVSIMFAYDYADGVANFTLPADVEYIDIEAENLDSHIVYMGSVWADNPAWEQTLLTGEYIITCTADNGDVYEGYVYI